MTVESDVEQKVQQIEQLMNQLGISLDYTVDGLTIEYQGKSYPIIDLENQHDRSTAFPRFVEAQRLLVKE